MMKPSHFISLRRKEIECFDRLGVDDGEVIFAENSRTLKKIDFIMARFLKTRRPSQFFFIHHSWFDLVSAHSLFCFHYMF